MAAPNFRRQSRLPLVSVPRHPPRLTAATALAALPFLFLSLPATILPPRFAVCGRWEGEFFSL
jgi:hypothetical protein